MDWPHQISEHQAVLDAMAGHKRIVVTSPTGTGKTRMMENKLQWCGENNRKALLITHRRMLFDQTFDHLTARGFDVGKIAAGHSGATLRDIQLCMIQTLARRNEMPPADLLIIDEAHLNRGEQAQAILKHYANSTVIGYTATPLGIRHIYDHLIVACDMREGRKCGALLPAEVYGPDEPDTKALEKRKKDACDWTEQDLRKLIRPKIIFGRVLKWWKLLNPTAAPTILFAPGVAESIALAECFWKSGIPAAHIDGKQIWWNGEFYDTSPELRAMIRSASENFELPVVCNRFVLREGIDWPFLQHLIFATPVGSVQSYIQAAGRLLRNYEGLEKVVIQDHGGNWWRHGSPNASREWSLDHTDRLVYLERRDKIRGDKEPEPAACPQCGIVTIKLNGACHNCGFKHRTRSRQVIQIDGTAKTLEGRIFREPRRVEKPNTKKRWISMYWRAVKSRNGMTFAQAEGLFVKENHYYPPRNMPYMPQEPLDWHRKVRDVPQESLT